MTTLEPSVHPVQTAGARSRAVTLENAKLPRLGENESGYLEMSSWNVTSVLNLAHGLKLPHQILSKCSCCQPSSVLLVQPFSPAVRLCQEVPLYLTLHSILPIKRQLILAEFFH